MLTPNLCKIISDCWDDFLKSASTSCIVKPSIPILWFGDLEQYRKSDKRILTVALNPSNKEFSNNGQSPYSIGLRFPAVSNLGSQTTPLSCSNIQNYYSAMNEYFKKNPYKTWFNWFERPLNCIAASYYDCIEASYYDCIEASYYDGNDAPKRRAIHIDVYAPVATVPTWGKLNPQEKTALAVFRNYYNRLIDELDPDVILISTNQPVINAIFGVTANSAVYTAKKKGAYIRVYQPNGSSPIVISGYNNRGMPFGMAGVFVKNEMKGIRTKFNI